MDSSAITAHYLANSWTVSPADLEDQRIVFVSDSSVGSQNLSLSLKAICNQDIRLTNEFSGEGQFDYLIIKLSSEFQIYPESPLGRLAILTLEIKTDLPGSKFKNAEFVGQFSNQIVYKPDTTIPSDSLFNVLIKNIPKLLFYKKGTSHRVFCVRDRHAFYVSGSPNPSKSTIRRWRLSPQC